MSKHLKPWWVQALLVLALCCVIIEVGMASHQLGVGVGAVLVAYLIWASVFAGRTKPRRRTP